MKIIKFALLIITGLIIGYFVERMIGGNDGGGIGPDFNREANPHHDSFQEKIDSFKAIPKNTPPRASFIKLQGEIDEYYKYKMFSDNDRDKERLSRNLFAAYTAHFIQYVEYKFVSNSCFDYKYNSLLKEISDISKNPLLEKRAGAEVDLKLKALKEDILTLFKIRHYIRDVEDFSFQQYDIKTLFPRDSLFENLSFYKSILQKMKYLNKCKLLKSRVDNLSEILAKQHFEYLNNKINKNCQDYAAFETQKSFTDTVIKPLRDQVEGFKNYYDLNKSNYYNYHKELSNILDTYVDKAYDFFSDKPKDN